MKLPFVLISPVCYAIHPKWNGLAFQCGEQHKLVLEYSENLAGFSDDFTAAQHEEVAGDSYPIDLAF